MEIIFILFLVGFGIFIIIISNNYKEKKIINVSKLTSTQVKPVQSKIEVPVEVKFTTSTSYSNNEEKFKSIRKSAKGGWILNPEAPFELTLQTTKEITQKIRNILDDDLKYNYRKVEEIFAIFF